MCRSWGSRLTPTVLSGAFDKPAIHKRIVVVEAVLKHTVGEHATNELILAQVNLLESQVLVLYPNIDKT